MRTTLAIIGLSLALPLLPGCGQMGPLYMPPKEPPPPPTSAQPQADPETPAPADT